MNEVSNEKINNLRDIILDRADSEKKAALDSGRKEAEEWLSKENEKLEREAALILQDARKRAEDIRRRQILSAERENSADTLRLQSRILSDAMGRLQDKLVKLRERDDYADILTGMCIDGIEALDAKAPVKLRLSAVDMALGDDVIKNTLSVRPELDLTLASEPAPILGGCQLSTADGHKQVNMDWQSVSQDMADSLAQRLLPLL